MHDVIVIGGGISGLAAAAALSRDADVLLLEAEPALAYHASGRSAAMFLRFYGNPTIRALNEASADHHHHANGGVLGPRGFLMVSDDDHQAAFEVEHSQVGLARISPDEARAIFPILDTGHITHAAHTEDAYDLDTDLLVQNYRREAASQGADIITEGRVDRIEREGAGWRVGWAGGEAEARIIVNAAGAWADAVALMAGVAPLGLQPHRRSMAQLAAPGGLDVSSWPFVAAADEGWYAKPDAGRWLVSPADADPIDPFDAWADDMVLAEGLARYQEAVTEPVTRPLHSWAGLRTFAPDGTPVIGRDRQAEGFWWFAGQGGYGFQIAPAASILLADLVAGSSPALDKATIDALSPDRF